MSWQGTTYKQPEDQASTRDAAFWLWQTESQAYWLLEELHGHTMEDWAWEHSDGNFSDAMRYVVEKNGINLSKWAWLGKIRRAICH